MAVLCAQINSLRVEREGGGAGESDGGEIKHAPAAGLGLLLQQWSQRQESCRAVHCFKNILALLHVGVPVTLLMSVFARVSVAVVHQHAIAT
jgi:hypothetical protein